MKAELLSTAIAEDRARRMDAVLRGGHPGYDVVDQRRSLRRHRGDLPSREALAARRCARTRGPRRSFPRCAPLLSGWERADSIVVNPHKWMFTPFDASLLLFRAPRRFATRFSLVPEYLRTPKPEACTTSTSTASELGRRFRALKMWMQIRWFGVEGMAARLREHVRLARLLASWVDADPDWERLAPVPFSTVCLRYRKGDDLDAINEAILGRVNASGRGFPLAHEARGSLHAARRPRESEADRSARRQVLGRT